MTDPSEDAAGRLRCLAEAASDFKIDQRIPVRRYFRSGQEMIKMAEVYRNEGNEEAAYVLYMKYMTLFVEKLKTHKDYPHIIPAEKKKVNAKVREVMEITEKLKKTLRRKFEEEHDQWLRDERRRAAEQESRQEEERRRRAELEASIERDRQVAMWHQAQIDQEERERRGQSQQEYDPGKYSDIPTAPPPSYQELTQEIVPQIDRLTLEDRITVPQFDRTNKPSPSHVITAATLPSSSSSSSSGSTLPSSSSSSAGAMPSVPDRSLKPSTSSSGLRSVSMPGDLINKFLNIARVNSDRNIETLGTLGGRLSNNKFIISHLLIPKQQGKSDSCTMDGLEDVWDIHDRENIIFLGWIHTHPAYSVFLSSVDMHNQYEWQHMLPEVSENYFNEKYLFKHSRR